MKKLLIALAVVVALSTILTGCQPEEKSEGYSIPAEWAR